MGLFDEHPGTNSWWRLSKENYHDLAARERFLGTSSMDDESIDEPLEKDALKSSERRQFEFRNYIFCFTMVNALMLSVTVVLYSLFKLSWSTTDMNTNVKASPFYCNVFPLYVLSCSSP